jgi:F-type H+-transporting ATPase subunit epsilon
MADTVQFDLVSPERRLTSVAATAVQLPGADGDLTAMAGHAPVITTLRPGIVTAETAQGDVRFVVTGGFAEISPEAVTLLAERGMAAEDMKQSDLDALLGEARKTADGSDAAAKYLSDLQAVGAQLGLNAG